ncbi:MAG: DinB family protein [Anaerolineales bacterium]|nr:DinB family protein [Anaerolineales bacterium]
MPEQAMKIAEKLASEGKKTEAFFGGLAAEYWGTVVYSDETTWHVHQILAHFVSAETSILQLVQGVVAGQAGVAKDFDLEAFNQQQVTELQVRVPSELVQLFAQARAATVAFVAGLPAEDLERLGQHPWLGQTSVAEMLKLMYRHNQIHQRDIKRVIRV